MQTHHYNNVIFVGFTLKCETKRCRIQDTWIKETGDRIHGYMDTGYRIQDTVYRIRYTGYVDTGYRIQDTGYRIRVTGYRIMHSGLNENKCKNGFLASLFVFL